MLRAQWQPSHRVADPDTKSKICGSECRNEGIRNQFNIINRCIPWINITIYSCCSRYGSPDTGLRIWIFVRNAHPDPIIQADPELQKSIKYHQKLTIVIVNGMVSYYFGCCMSYGNPGYGCRSEYEIQCGSGNRKSINGSILLVVGAMGTPLGGRIRTF